MRREIITWSVVLVVILAAFGGTVLILNASLYSASGFVRGYLDSLARHDAEGALELAGEAVSGDASAALLTPRAMGSLSDIKLVGESVDAQGVHTVVYSYLAGGVAGESTFTVVHKGTLLGLFPTWAFETSPLAVIQLTVQHASAFTANGVALESPAPNQSVPYLVFAPGRYDIAHQSTWLQAKTVAVPVTAPATAVRAQLDIEANAAFGKQVQKEVNAYLDDCATQTVLLPTGCPFGESIGNRIVSTPAWRMSSYPPVVILPGAQAGEWLMPPTDAAAHLVVDVKSLFDGSVSTFDEDVPFSVSYRITFLPGGELNIAGQ
ncbi:hypothetical protein BH11ACT4_BH11ACT4_10080 [soil metagenome]